MQRAMMVECIRRLAAAMAVLAVSALFVFGFAVLLLQLSDPIRMCFLHALVVIVVGLAKRSFLRWGVPALALSAIWFWFLFSCNRIATLELVSDGFGLLLIVHNLFMMGTALCGKWCCYRRGWPWLFYLQLPFCESFTTLVRVYC